MSLNRNNLTLRIQLVLLSFYQLLFHRFCSSLNNWNSAHTVLAEQSLHRCFIESADIDVERLQTVLESALRHRLHDVLERRRVRLEVRFPVWITSIVEAQELGVVFVYCGEVQSSWRRRTWSLSARSWTKLWRFAPSSTQLVLNT